jgi:hypothetical protein
MRGGRLARCATARVPRRLLVALGVVLATAIGLAKPWSTEARSGDSLGGMMALVGLILLATVFMPAVVALKAKDWLASGVRPHSRPGTLAWIGARGLVLLSGLALVVAGPGVWVLLLVLRPKFSPLGWLALIAVLGPVALQGVILGTHMIELSVRLRSQHAWLRLLR